MHAASQFHFAVQWRPGWNALLNALAEETRGIPSSVCNNDVRVTSFFFLFGL
jgi:hypothetical protein